MKIAADEEARKEILDLVVNYRIDESKLPDLQRPILQLKYVPDEEFYRKLAIAAENKFILEAIPLRTIRPEIARDSEPEPTEKDEVVLVTNKHTQAGRLRDAAIEIQKTKDPESVIDRHLQTIASSNG